MVIYPTGKLLKFTRALKITNLSENIFLASSYEYRKTKQFQEKLKDSGLEMRTKEETSLEAQYEVVKEVIICIF